MSSNDDTIFTYCDQMELRESSKQICERLIMRLCERKHIHLELDAHELLIRYIGLFVTHFPYNPTSADDVVEMVMDWLYEEFEENKMIKRNDLIRMLPDCIYNDIFFSLLYYNTHTMEK